MLKTTTIAATILLLPRLCLGADASAMSVEEIRECVERSGPAKSSIQHATLRTADERGHTRESVAKLHWAKQDDGLSRALIRFSAPPDLRGSAVLVLEKSEGKTDMFMYLPEFRSVRRVTTGMMSGAMFGTDFTYEEFERLYGLADDLESRRLPDGKLADRAVFVIEALPDEDQGSSYERIVQYIEQKRCVALKSEFFEGEGELRKVLSVDPARLRQVEGAWIAEQIVMRDLRDGTHTTLDVKKVEVDVEIPARTFSQGSLSRGH